MRHPADVVGPWGVGASDELRTEEERDAVGVWLANHHARCPRCRHDLHGARDGRCAECGLPVVLVPRRWSLATRDIVMALALVTVAALPHLVIGLWSIRRSGAAWLGVLVGGAPLAVLLGSRVVLRWMRGQVAAAQEHCAGLVVLAAIAAWLLPFVMMLGMAGWLWAIGIAILFDLLLVTTALRPTPSRSWPATFAVLGWIAMLNVWLLALGAGA